MVSTPYLIFLCGIKRVCVMRILSAMQLVEPIFKNYLFLIMCVCDGVCVWVCPCEYSSRGAQESYRQPGAAWLESWRPRLGPLEGLHGELFIAELFLQSPWSNFGHDLILTARYPSCTYSHLSFTYLRWMVFLYDCKEGILVLASIEIVQGIWAGRSFTLSCGTRDVWGPCRAGPTLLMKNSILAPKCICASFKWQSQ